MKPFFLIAINLLLLAGMPDLTMNGQTVQVTPDFSIWFECVQRGPYPGMAQANISYRYDGEFALAPEDSRLFGDTITGETVVYPFSILPGTQERAIALNVGALKVVTLKIILFGKLHVVTVWDDPIVKDCAWVLPDATPEMPNA